MKSVVCFDDVLLVPGFSDITSRAKIDISSTLGKHQFRLPIISSPMDTVTESPMAAAIFDYGGLSIIHRYNTIDTQCKHVECLPADSLVGAAIGVTGDYIDRATALYDAGANVLCVDIAHGHHILMKDALHRLREIFGNAIHIMAGNVATLAGFNDLADWGADSIRVGIGGGSICSTRIQAGHGVPTLQSVLDCSASDRGAVLIADGGIRNSGDIVKALAAGADFVMLGSLLAGTDESPGKRIKTAQGDFKTYRGMASTDAQMAWRGRTSSIEGISSLVPYRGSVLGILDELALGIRSGLSYSGAKNLLEFQVRANFIQQSQAAIIEGTTHIRSRAVSFNAK